MSTVGRSAAQDQVKDKASKELHFPCRMARFEGAMFVIAHVPFSAPSTAKASDCQEGARKIFRRDVLPPRHIRGLSLFAFGLSGPRD